MKAVTYRTKGAAAEVLKLEELPRPEPGPGEVLLRMAYSGVNPSDTKGRAGIAGGPLAYPYVVPHHDGAGRIVQVGKGVPPARLNQRVWTVFAQWGRQHGTAADYLALPLRLVQALPAAVSAQVGASIGIPLMTAVHALRSSGPLQGRRVLITGGAGAVGHYAIQLARRAGAQVASTVSSPAKAAWAATAGADLVVSYHDADWLERLESFTAGQGFELIIEVDAAGNAHHYERLLAFGGEVLVYGSGKPDISLSYRGIMSRFARLRAFVVYLLPPAQLRAALRAMTALLEEGSLIHPDAAVFAPESAAQAHEHVERGLGKALIQFDGGAA